MLIIRTYKTIIFFASNFFFLFVGAAINLFAIPCGERRRARAQAVLTMLWCKCVCFILGIHVTKSGHRSKKGGFTVSNHAGYADVFVMGSQRPTSFLSKHDVRDWPIIGWLAYLGGTVFVNRNSKRAALLAMAEIEKKIDAGITVIIFPEGTTSHGKTIRVFKSTFFKIPVTKNIPVRPASIKYADDAVAAVAWYGGMHIAASVSRCITILLSGPWLNGGWRWRQEKISAHLRRTALWPDWKTGNGDIRRINGQKGNGEN
jgi:1-acyl-sn-glycerol-3-phosphate acyltransferase